MVFERRLKRTFLHLHQATGERLLFFFIPIDEPEHWRKSMQSSLWGSALQLYETMPDKLHSRDPLRSEQIFATTLGISTDELPVIVVCEDLGHPDYYVIRSSRESVRNQLLALGSLALDLHEQGKSLPWSVYLLRKIDCCSGLHGGGLVEPLASLLHDSLSIILATNSEKHSLSSRVARKSLLERCRRPQKPA